MFNKFNLSLLIWTALHIWPIHTQFSAPLGLAKQRIGYELQQTFTMERFNAGLSNLPEFVRHWAIVLNVPNNVGLLTLVRSDDPDLFWLYTILHQLGNDLFSSGSFISGRKQAVERTAIKDQHPPLKRGPLVSPFLLKPHHFRYEVPLLEIFPCAWKHQKNTGWSWSGQGSSNSRTV